MWILVIALVALALVAAVANRLHGRKADCGGRADAPGAEGEVAGASSGECCGQHAVCERDSLLAAVSRRVEYYDDEELDRYVGTSPGSYTPAQVEEFREVFYTMQEADVPGWVRSLQLRGIALPDELRDEVLLVVGERRREASRP